MLVKNLLSKYNRSNLIFIGCALVASLFVSMLVEVVVFNLLFGRGHDFYFYPVRFLVVAAFLYGLALLIKFRHYFADNLHKAFLLIALVAGVSYVIVLPRALYSCPDDQIHFVRALALSGDEVAASDAFRMIEASSTTDLISSAGFSGQAAIYHDINAAHQPNTVQIIPLNDGAELYQRLIYLPYYIGFKLSSFLHFDFITTIVVAKLCNMLCYIAIFYFAIKLTRKQLRPIFFVTGLIVSSMYLASQFSADPMIIASLNLAIALFICMLGQAKIDPKYLIAFVLIAAWGCLPKAIYCPLLLLPLILSKKQFDTPRRAMVVKIGLVIITLLLAATFVLPALSGGMAPDIRGGNTSVSGQLQFLISHPVRAVVVVFRSTAEIVAAEFLTGNSFGAMDYLPTKHYTVALVGLIQLVTFFSVIFTTKLDRRIFTPRVKLYLAFAFLVIVEAIVASLYLAYTPVGAPHVKGIQFRYFLPLLPVFMFALAPTDTKPQTYRYTKPLIFVFYFCLACTVVVYIAKYSII